MRAKAEGFRTMAEHPRIALEATVLAGKPVVWGTRLSVELVIGLLAEGWSEGEILANYRGLTHPRLPRLRARYARLGEGVPERGLRCVSRS